MLGFETLTVVPFDNRLLDKSLLTPAEVSWIDAYHRRVNELLSPLLAGEEKQWMERATRPIAA